MTDFNEGRDLEDINGIMSSERVVNSFKNYFKRVEIDLKEIAELHDEFELEYAMSQIFSKKQKVLALANPDLHKLASKL